MYDLKKKSNSVSWSKNKRIEYFGIVAKKIEGKEKLKIRDIHFLLGKLK